MSEQVDIDALARSLGVNPQRLRQSLTALAHDPDAAPVKKVAPDGGPISNYQAKGSKKISTMRVTLKGTPNAPPRLINVSDFSDSLHIRVSQGRVRLEEETPKSQLKSGFGSQTREELATMEVGTLRALREWKFVPYPERPRTKDEIVDEILKVRGTTKE